MSRRIVRPQRASARAPRRRLPLRQTPLSQRIWLDDGVPREWKPSADARWQEWKEYLTDDALRAYRLLRRVAAGEEDVRSLQDLWERLDIGRPKLLDILYTLDRLGFIVWRR